MLELDCGTYILECTAITEYIDHHFEGPSLTSETPKQRALVHMMQRRAEQYMMDAVGTYFHHVTEGLGPELEAEQIPAWGNRQHTIASEGMQYFDKVLASSAYVAARPSVLALAG